ncbi:hypothetical protein OOK27_27410 [Streptomyces canus]|nr:hypothetical protein [Streptomyces canus]MCX5257804.1 hypothetical protein [Streptomyces canus]
MSLLNELPVAVEVPVKLSHVGQKMDLWVKIADVKIAFPSR